MAARTCPEKSLTSAPERSGHCGAYDPFTHAQELGIHVAYDALPDRWAEYWHRARVVVLRADGTATQQRCALAHEIVHAEHGDVITGQCWFDGRMERRADRMAARRLVTRQALRAACALYPDDTCRVAQELGVTACVLYAALEIYAD